MHNKHCVNRRVFFFLFASGGTFTAGKHWPKFAFKSQHRYQGLGPHNYENTGKPALCSFIMSRNAQVKTSQANSSGVTRGEQRGQVPQALPWASPLAGHKIKFLTCFLHLKTTNFRDNEHHFYFLPNLPRVKGAILTDCPRRHNL